MGRESKSRDLMPRLLSDAKGSYWLAQNGLRYYSDEDGVTWQGWPIPHEASEENWLHEIEEILRKYLPDSADTNELALELLGALDSFCHNLARYLVTDPTCARLRRSLHKFTLNNIRKSMPLAPSAEGAVLNQYIMTTRDGDALFTDTLQAPNEWKKLTPKAARAHAALPKRDDANPVLKELVFTLVDILKKAGLKVTHTTYKKTEYMRSPQSAAGRLICDLVATVLPNKVASADMISTYLSNTLHLKTPEAKNKKKAGKPTK